jgi:hypothetical protein
VAIGTVLFGLFGFAADAAMTRFKISDDIHAGMVGAIVGLGAGLSFWILLAGLRERRIRLADEIHRLAELNHTVRNSLHQIVLAHYLADEEHKRLVLESTARIDEKLKELFPVVGTPRKWRKKEHTSKRGST